MPRNDEHAPILAAATAGRPPNFADNPPPPIVPPLDWRRTDLLFNRFPLKHGWDALALGQITLRTDLSLKQKLDCWKFYFETGKIRNLYASLTRCGSRWTTLGLTLALDLANGGDGNFWLDGDYWRFDYGVRYTKLDWREPMGHVADIKRWGTPVTDPFIYHSHHPYYRIRSAQLKNMKTVVVVRSILDSMESLFFKLAKVPDHPDEEDDRNFPWERRVLHSIEFLNSWGDAIRWHRHCRVFKYEELLADSAGCHQQMADHWGLNIPEDCMREAFSRITKDKMREKIVAAGIEGQQRVSFRSEMAAMPPYRREQLQKLIEKHLVFDFGYDHFSGLGKGK